ncbi:MAG: TRAP transporter substrate-binding protein [Proteobacteria bacterium]|nr:TRAP transporter substrate-binding protein [Pseudomonadota bacterium]
MKKLKVLLAPAVISLLFLTVPNAAMAVKLTYANFFPPTHIQSKLADQWCKEVKQVTNGEVIVQYYPGGTLLKPRQIYDGVVNGIADIGFSVLAYSGGRFPVMGTIDLPLGYPSGEVATQVANAVFNKFNPREFKDVKVMFFHAHGPGMFFTAKTPVRKLEDLSGLKLRATAYAAKIVKAAGGTPVGGPMTEAYQNIQKGVVNGGVYPMETNKGWKMGEVVDYGTAAYDIAYTTTFFIVMNKNKWRKLSKKSQQAIEQLNKKYIALHGEAWDVSDTQGLKSFLSQGNTLIGLDKRESAKWKKAVEPIIGDYAKALDKKRLNGDEIVKYTVDTLKSLQ